MSIKPTPQFLVKYNGYTLPGYAQEESLEGSIQDQDYVVPYSYEALSDNMGEQAKQMSVTMMVWDDSYTGCKNQIQTAATYLKSKRGDYGNLYLGQSDRHYQVIPTDIKYDKKATDQQVTATYDVSFKAKPYLTSDAYYHISNYTASGVISSVITTDNTKYSSYYPAIYPVASGVTVSGYTESSYGARTISDGMYSPCWVVINNIGATSTVTVSGYLSTGDFCGFIAASGTIPNSLSLIVDGHNYTAEDTWGNNQNSHMLNPDYAVFVGPGKTTFVCTGSAKVDIYWKNRWYL